MIDLSFIAESNIVSAKISGELHATDWTNVTPIIDKQIAEHGKINLLLDATDFDGWEDLKAAKTHLNFVKYHHNKIQRVALIAGKRWQHWVAAAASVFVDADLKIFDEEHAYKAQEWVQGNEIPELHLSIKCRGQAHTLGIRAFGKISSDDYEKILIPAMEDMIKEHSPINVLVDLSEFQGMEAGAFWDDFKFGIKHLNDFRRLALVGGQKWIDWAAKLADPITKIHIKAFHVNELEKAWRWVEEP